MTGNTADVWPCYSSRSDGDILRVWFSSCRSVPSEHSAKMTAPLEAVMEIVTDETGVYENNITLNLKEVLGKKPYLC